MSSYFPKASAIAHDTYKGIYTRALKEMPEDVQSSGEGRLLLDEMFADAMEQTKRMLASTKELEEAVQNLHNRPYTYLNWKAIFAKPPSILDRGNICTSTGYSIRLTPPRMSTSAASEKVTWLR